MIMHGDSRHTITHQGILDNHVAISLGSRARSKHAGAGASAAQESVETGVVPGNRIVINSKAQPVYRMRESCGSVGSHCDSTMVAVPLNIVLRDEVVVSRARLVGNENATGISLYSIFRDDGMVRAHKVKTFATIIAFI